MSIAAWKIFARSRKKIDAGQVAQEKVDRAMTKQKDLSAHAVAELLRIPKRKFPLKSSPTFRSLSVLGVPMLCNLYLRTSAYLLVISLARVGISITWCWCHAHGCILRDGGVYLDMDTTRRHADADKLDKLQEDVVEANIEELASWLSSTNLADILSPILQPVGGQAWA
ncbi:uncharacterized protein EV420DRAFT_1487965 [Desarmillaria tabescens]|uniref:Uncharacterized protein n=1 Tax=Armillaria tabescens TaxID=1929756 RepID=A0AA39J3N5_ARMTA|nr:uncharacterized protein EV420DRAFT_1487965 [Desarmillaria tabescens]KAK0435458.1 hypothetical protein EV420DRAFT_1487965 [Desarmillaria tabescens]